MKVNSDKFQYLLLGKVVNAGTFLINGNAELYENTKLAGCIQFYLATRRVMSPLIRIMQKKRWIEISMTAARLRIECHSRSSLN